MIAFIDEPETETIDKESSIGFTNTLFLVMTKHVCKGYQRVTMIGKGMKI